MRYFTNATERYPRRKSSDSVWPLKTSTGETFAERKERQEASNGK